MTIEEIEAHMEENDGFCTTCMEVTNCGGVEPDARNYRCEQCGNFTVFGLEEALIMEVIPVTGDDD